MCFHSASSLGFLFEFFGIIKSDTITLTNLIPILDGTWTHHLSDGCLLVQTLLWIFLTERLDAIDKTWFYKIIFYCTINRKRLGMCIFPKLALIAKKSPLKVNSTTFLFREVEQLAVYQLLPNLTISEDFGWLSSGSEPVMSIWEPLWDIHRKSKAPVTFRIFRVISIDLITF